MRLIVSALAVVLSACAAPVLSTVEMRGRPAAGHVLSTMPPIEAAACVVERGENGPDAIPKAYPLQMRQRPGGYEVISGGDYGNIYSLIDVTEHEGGSMLTAWRTPALNETQRGVNEDMQRLMASCANG